MQPVVYCPSCNATLSKEKPHCDDCNVDGIVGQPYNAQVDTVGKRNSLENNPQRFKNTTPFVPKNVSLNSSKYNNTKVAKKKGLQETDETEDAEGRVSKEYVSEEFSQCSNPSVNNRQKKRRDVDRILEVTKSCEDLEIDG
jgi:hypothetical protein